MSQFQLVPYNRIQDYFADQLHIPVSEGSIFNFNKEAFRSLADFESRVKNELAASDLHMRMKRASISVAKDTGCIAYPMIAGHFIIPMKKGEQMPMNDMGVLPRFKGILCHDHWKPYYKIDCTHALCNAHHLRELTRAWEQDGQQWAQKLKNLLETINRKVTDAGGALDAQESQKYRLKYRVITKTRRNRMPGTNQAQKKGQKRPDQKIKIQKLVGAVKRL